MDSDFKTLLYCMGVASSMLILGPPLALAVEQERPRKSLNEPSTASIGRIRHEVARRIYAARVNYSTIEQLLAKQPQGYHNIPDNIHNLQKYLRIEIAANRGYLQELSE